ncbi:MAG: hypothetical protein ACRDVN_00290 [Jiangellaceae bacterium]
MAHEDEPPTGGGHYRIVVAGEFGDLLSAAFDDVIVSTGGGKTVLIAPVRDGQELYGLMDRLRDHGIRLETVAPSEKPADSQGPSADPGVPHA